MPELRHSKVKSIPRLKTEIEPIGDMGVLNGDSAPVEIAGNTDSRAERDNRTNRGNLDDDPVLVQSPLGADIRRGAYETGRLFQRRLSFQTAVDIHAAGQPGDIATLQGTGEKDIGVAGKLEQIGGSKEGR